MCPGQDCHWRNSALKAILILTGACFLITSLACNPVREKEDLDKGHARRTLGSLDPHVRELVLASLAQTDQKWDERAGMLWNAEPGTQGDTKKTELTAYQKAIKSRLRTDLNHDVRKTSCYALGLLLRDGAEDIERACQALNAVLDQQIDRPGQLCHGTFYRSPEESPPPTNPQDLLWTHYDPNWRQFIGTTLAIIFEEYEDRIPDSLVERMDKALGRAVDGETNEFRSQHRGRGGPKENKGLENYTNIALMHAFLWTYAGKRLNRPEWIKKGEDFAARIYKNFKRFGTFEEYNSPSYYGVDLFALALWRSYGPTKLLREMGTELEAELWKDIALHYHAGLKNMAGPYSRAYGMDMTTYVQLTGLWLRTVLEAKDAPLPETGDFDYVPHFAILGTIIPSEALDHFKRFVGERLVERRITLERVATSWLGEKYMLGAEVTALTRMVASQGEPAAHQYHPVTVHWKTPAGELSWIKLIDSSRIDARAEEGQLSIDCIGDATFRVFCSSAKATSLRPDLWVLPGLTVNLDTDALHSNMIEGDGYVDMHYLAATRFMMRFSSPAQK
jgi:hypothetical protein